MKLADASFTVFDVETTGLYPYAGDMICEIAAIRVDGRSEAKKFHSLIDPGRPISPGAFAVNGITPEMLAGKPAIDTVLPGFMRFIEGSVLVAYNAGFDLGFLECALGGGREKLDEFYIVDALALARRLFPGIGRYSLGIVAGALGVEVGIEHRALADALMTLRVFEREIVKLQELGIDTVEAVERVRPLRSAPARLVRDCTTARIEEAIRGRKRLNIVYRSSWNNALTRRTVTPRKLQEGYDRSYLVARCHLRDEERVFRLDCIMEIEKEK